MRSVIVVTVLDGYRRLITDYLIPVDLPTRSLNIRLFAQIIIVFILLIASILSLLFPGFISC